MNNQCKKKCVTLNQKNRQFERKIIHVKIGLNSKTFLLINHFFVIADLNNMLFKKLLEIRSLDIFRQYN